MEANVPPTPPGDGQVNRATTSDDTAKRLRVVTIVAVVLGLIAAGLAIWGVSNKSKLDDAETKLAQQQTQDADSLLSVRNKYLAVRRALGGREVEVSELEAEVKRQHAALLEATKQVKNADTNEQRDEAEVSQLEAQLRLARACSEGAVSEIGRLINENQNAADTAGTLQKLQQLRDECAAANSGS